MFIFFVGNNSISWVRQRKQWANQVTSWYIQEDLLHSEWGGPWLDFKSLILNCSIIHQQWINETLNEQNYCTCNSHFQTVVHSNLSLLKTKCLLHLIFDWWKYGWWYVNIIYKALEASCTFKQSLVSVTAFYQCRLYREQLTLLRGKK